MPARGANIGKYKMTHIGIHYIVDFIDAKHLNDLEYIEQTLRKAVEVSKATLLNIHLHHFSNYDGVTGVAILAESHISIHTWPEHNYAAVDIFMCGNTEPVLALGVLCEAFDAKDMIIKTHKRGER